METLIELSKNRNADAFAQLIQGQMQTLYKTARAFLAADEDVADAVQETILACWEKLPGLRDNRYFRTWLVRILVNKCRDILREKKRYDGSGEIPDQPTEETGYANVEWNEILGMLNEKQRAVVVLYYAEGFKTSEIGNILGIPGSTVRSCLAQARKKLEQDYYPEIKRRKPV